MPSWVLIIDDQQTGSRILEKIILGIDPKLSIKIFSLPKEALIWLEEHSPDLILSDFKMPSMNGVELTRQIRKIPHCADVPLMIVTIVADKQTRYDALEAGASDFLSRPIDQQECQARCRNLLKMRQQHKTIQYHARSLEEQIQQATQEVARREQETLLRLAKAGEYRDEETGNHMIRMAKYARFIAEALNLDTKCCEEIERTAPMHDIGKIGIPDHILLKPGKLNANEWKIMKTHTTIGYNILKQSDSHYIQQGATIALTHHEKFDGSGYPAGIKGNKIPLVSRIIALADMYDALTSIRPYKPAWSSEKAAQHIESLRGSHFDPDCVDAFFQQLDKIRVVEERLRDQVPTAKAHP
ncbi:MAG: response regulator [Gammaproteobacteria bacterium]|nr:response regulator [Gammaproteobacteria bacterium]